MFSSHPSSTTTSSAARSSGLLLRAIVGHCTGGGDAEIGVRESRGGLIDVRREGKGEKKEETWDNTDDAPFQLLTGALKGEALKQWNQQRAIRITAPSEARPITVTPSLILESPIKQTCSTLGCGVTTENPCRGTGRTCRLLISFFCGAIIFHHFPSPPLHTTVPHWTTEVLQNTQ